MRISITAALLAGSILTVTPANAVAIVGLFNTGVAADGVTLLAADGATELHYDDGLRTLPITYSNGAYAPVTDARFIGALAGGNYPRTPITYNLSFDLTGLNAATAMLSGFWAADNYGSVSLNGNLLASLANDNSSSNYNTLHAFSATTGFLAGLNTLSFVIGDTGPPSSFVVSGLSGSADAISGAVPEPATWGLMVLGFGGMGYAMRRNRRVAFSFS